MSSQQKLLIVCAEENKSLVTVSCPPFSRLYMHIIKVPAA